MNSQSDRKLRSMHCIGIIMVTPARKIRLMHMATMMSKKDTENQINAIVNRGRERHPLKWGKIKGALFVTDKGVF